MFDSHTHTTYSIDSEMNAEDATKKAAELGLEGIAFTDHMDIDYPGDEEFNFSIQDYSRYIDDLKNKYSDKIKVLKGIEIGVQPHVTAKNIEFSLSTDFDFIIASIHIIDRMDPYTGEFYIGRTKEDAFTRYLEAIYEGTLTFKNYDVIGHIGYIRRYGDIKDRSMFYKDYSDILDKILKQVIQDGKGIEVNTSGLRGILGSTIPDESILTRYRELGGEIITIGSDAHAAKDIGSDFIETCQLIQKIGYKYTCHFINRKPVFDKL
jgi:histidinol phosphate phosphatase HisJ family